MQNPYARDVSRISTLDPYRLQELYKMHPCAEHVVKKLLLAGEREGGKNLDHDISDCIRTLTRWQEMRAEDANNAPRDPARPVTAVVPTLYDWTAVPGHYYWMATNESGEVFAYECRPTPDCGRWNSMVPEARTKRMQGVTAAKVDWVESLEKRP